MMKNDSGLVSLDGSPLSLYSTGTTGSIENWPNGVAANVERSLFNGPKSIGSEGQPKCLDNQQKSDQAQNIKRDIHGVTTVENLDIKKIRTGI